MAKRRKKSSSKLPRTVKFRGGKTVTFRRKKAKKGARKGYFMKGRIKAPPKKKHGTIITRSGKKYMVMRFIDGWGNRQAYAQRVRHG